MTTRHFTRREALKFGTLGAGVLLLPSALRSGTARAAGAHLPGPTQASLPDGSPDPTIRRGQHFPHPTPNTASHRPATLAYHDHSIHVTAENVYRGLLGFYILQDDLEDALPLPKGYGVHDIPLSLKDAVITGTGGTLVYANNDHKGVEGDVQIVNGVQQPRFAVANRKYRFRISNHSDARVYRVALHDRSEIVMIGSDQGLLERPVPVLGFRIAPLERYEFVIDFSRYPIGTRVILENTLAQPDSPVRQLMAFDVVRRESEDSQVPDFLRPLERIPRSLAVRERTFNFVRSGGYFTVNGRTWNRNRVDANPRVNTTEIWHLVNGGGGWTHPIHIHLVRFLILGVAGRPLEPYERGWKDMVWLGPNVRASVIMQFANFRGRYLIHCHNGSHEDHDMMTQFDVV